MHLHCRGTQRNNICVEKYKQIKFLQEERKSQQVDKTFKMTIFFGQWQHS